MADVAEDLTGRDHPTDRVPTGRRFTVSEAAPSEAAESPESPDPNPTPTPTDTSSTQETQASRPWWRRVFGR
jgi:hypothetical protein